VSLRSSLFPVRLEHVSEELDVLPSTIVALVYENASCAVRPCPIRSRRLNSILTCVDQLLFGCRSKAGQRTPLDLRPEGIVDHIRFTITELL